MLPGTAQTWIDAITHGRAWDEELDADRLRRGFVVLTQTIRRWPAPVEFLEAVPRREVLMLERKPPASTPESRANAERAMAEMRAMFARGGEGRSPGPPGQPTPAIATVEKELRQHYDRKKAAAGDVS